MIGSRQIFHDMPQFGIDTLVFASQGPLHVSGTAGSWLDWEWNNFTAEKDITIKNARGMTVPAIESFDSNLSITYASGTVLRGTSTSPHSTCAGVAKRWGSGYILFDVEADNARPYSGLTYQNYVGTTQFQCFVTGGFPAGATKAKLHYNTNLQLHLHHEFTTYQAIYVSPTNTSLNIPVSAGDTFGLYVDDIAFIELDYE